MQSPVIVQNSHHSTREPNTRNTQASVALRRNDSSILVITSPLNNSVVINREFLNHNNQLNSAQPQHIIANIENNYELDDNISCSNISFKNYTRHPEGEEASSRGNMHNNYDNTSVSTTNTSAKTRNATVGDNESNFHRIVPEGSEEEIATARDIDREEREIVKSCRFNTAKLGTSMFIENSDILNDKNYPRFSHHHSQFLFPSASSRIADSKLKDRRRYSDTKLLKNSSCDFENEFLINKSALFGESTRGGSEDLIFERCDDVFDPIDLNIQNILEIDIQTNKVKEEQNK